MTTDDYNVYIGQNTEFAGPCWNALVDDVRIYSYALSGAETKALYAGKGPDHSMPF